MRTREELPVCVECVGRKKGMSYEDQGRTACMCGVCGKEERHEL